MSRKKPDGRKTSTDAFAMALGVGLLLIGFGVAAIAWHGVWGQRGFIPLEADVARVYGILSIAMGAALLVAAGYFRRKGRG